MTSSDRSEFPAPESSLGPRASGKTILIADPDTAAARRLSTALRLRGHHVLSCRDGSKALEVAVLRAPDLVLYDVACAMLEASVFVEILRANPRTAAVPVVLIGSEEASEKIRGSFRSGFLQKPFNVDEVLARVSHLMRRVETAEKVRRAGAIEGSLEQIGLPDILQILSMNRRSGVLRVAASTGGEDGPRKAELLLGDGRVTDARVGEISGEKALFRALLWEQGNFTFTPGPPVASGRIRLSMDEVLLEGLRQKDELEALTKKSISRDDVVAIAVEAENIPGGLHPVTEEVMGLLAFYRTVGEVVDHARATDLDVMRAIGTLVERGLVRVLGRALPDDGGKPLVGADVVLALHGHLMTCSGGVEACARVVVAASDPQRLGRIAAEMSSVAGWRPDSGPKLLELGFGGIGEVRLTESLRIALTALPVDDQLSPVWRPFGSGAMGAVIMSGPKTRGLVDHMVDRGLPVVLAGSEAEAEAADSRGKPAAAPGFLEGLAKLLGMVARGRGARA